jgi:hypothetical protein
MKRIFGLLAIVFAGSLQAAESFLGPTEIAVLKPHPNVEGLERHITPGADPKAYGKIIVGSVTFYFAEKSKANAMDADDLKQVSDAMKAALLSAALANDEHEVVLEAGPGAALINVAITDVNVQNKKRGLLGYTPVGFVVKSAGNLAGMRLQLKGAHIEGEVVDSVSGEVVSIFRIDEIGEFDDKKGLSWEDLRVTFEKSATLALASRTR